MQETLSPRQNIAAQNYTVSQVSQLVRGVLESSFNNIKVVGEIAEITHAKSGHVYFTIKDENAILNVICWRGVFQTLKVQLDIGMEVICQGKISSYPQRSNYQFILSHLEIAGDGALMKIFNERKAKLAQMGVFDPKFKKNIPAIPKSICVITSETGAVIRDIIHRISARFPMTIYLYHCQVQGKDAHFDIANAINAVNASDIIKPDLLIVARGGGSMQDLWPFNEEQVAIAVYKSQIPIISAVGHETDFTLCDFAADLRAPTPTAAAEIATPDRAEIIKYHLRILNNLNIFINRIIKIFNYQLREQYNRYYHFTHKLNLKSQEIAYLLKGCENKLQRRIAHVEGLINAVNPSLMRRYFDKSAQCALHNMSIKNAIQRKLDSNGQNVLSLARVLNNLNPQRVLERGYIIARQDGRVLSSKSQLNGSKAISLQFKDGIIDISPKD